MGMMSTFSKYLHRGLHLLTRRVTRVGTGDRLYDTVGLCKLRRNPVGVRAEASVKWLRDMKSTCIRIGNVVKSTLVQMKYLQIMDFIIWKLQRNWLCK